MEVRMMLHMGIRCATCGNCMYKDTLFNSRIENVIGETYMGIRIFRFYINCTMCSAQITYKTDPKNSDFTVESGATRNYDPWCGQDEELEKKKQKNDAEEMDILAALDELKSIHSRRAAVRVDLH